MAEFIPQRSAFDRSTFLGCTPDHRMGFKRKVLKSAQQGQTVLKERNFFTWET